MFSQSNQYFSNGSLSIDLHGLSVKEAKKTVDAMLEYSKSNEFEDITIITGIGNHVNQNGTRGVLFKALPKWLKKSSFKNNIKQIGADRGAYELQFSFNQDYHDYINSVNSDIQRQLSPDSLNKFIEEHTQRSQAADSASQAILGSMYLNGIGMAQDIQQGLDLLKLAAKHQIAVTVQLGHIYSSNNFPFKDYKIAYNYFKEAADLKDPEALFNLGKMYWLGRGVIKNDKKAITYLTEAADLNHAAAAHNLANLYYYGEEKIEPNFSLAIQYYLKSVKNGYLPDKVQLGKIYFYAKGAKQDYKKAFEWFSQAAKDNDKFGLYYVGYCYENGYGVSVNLDKASQYFTAAAEQGDPDAKFKLAYNQLIGSEGEQTIKSGLEMLSELAEQNHPDSLYLLGIMLYMPAQANLPQALDALTRSANLGNLKAQKFLANAYLTKSFNLNDSDKTIHWLKAAADQEDTESMYILAIVQGHQDNYSASGEWFFYLQKSAELGFIKAQHLMGMVYLSDEIVPQNQKSAIKWLEKAAKGGHVEAHVELAKRCLSRGTRLYNPEQGFFYCQQAAARHDPTALCILGYCYQDGMGTKINLQKAKESFAKAAIQNDEAAQANFLSLVEDDIDRGKLRPEDERGLTALAEQGNLDAQYLMGKFCLHPKQSDRSSNTGIYCLYQAAIKEHEGAIESLSMMLSSGFKQAFESILVTEYSARQKAFNQEEFSQLMAAYAPQPQKSALEAIQGLGSKLGLWGQNSTPQEVKPDRLNQQEFLTTFAKLFKLNVEWKIAKAGNAWCYLNQENQDKLSSYQVSPFSVRRTTDGKGILFLEKISQVNFESVIASLTLQLNSKPTCSMR